tara:strand:- start:2377 stop:2622 length:246 start_codon:yes stop_codon:yes gene_type:complete
MSKEIPTKDYMQDGWDSGPIGCHPYKRGSRHNKIGMWIMWIFYVIVIVQVLYAITIIPFFPITFLMLSFGLYILFQGWIAR